MSAKLSVRDLDVKGLRVFCRVDFNVPLSNGRVDDDQRIVASVPTIRLLSGLGAKVVLASHLGRPKGKPNPSLGLSPAAHRLSELLGTEVPLAPDCIGPSAASAVEQLQAGGTLLLENLRFHPEEEKNDPGFSEQLAALADVYVNDAFGSAHRAHASTVGVAKRLRQAAAGLLMQAELENLSVLLESPKTPYAAVLGGAKVSDKLDLIENLLPRVTRILVGGAMAYTFLKAKGVEVGDSRVEEDRVDTARSLMEKAAQRGVPILLPTDHRIRALAQGDAAVRITPDAAIPSGSKGFDIGPATIKAFTAALRDARTVLWNGPVGLFEEPPFDEGSRAVAEAIASSGAHSVVGGGDSASAVRRFGLEKRFTHVSTGGGATLEYLSGLALPGVEALTDAR